MVKTLVLPMQRARVQSLVRELGSHMPRGVAPKKKTNPYDHGAYIPIWRKVTKGRQIANIFLNSDVLTVIR